MLDVKEAVAAAIEFIKHLYDAKALPDLRLEEVELADDEQYWFVTLGFRNLVQSNSPLDAIVPPRHERIYKVIKVDALTGRSLAMTIRET